MNAPALNLVSVRAGGTGRTVQTSHGGSPLHAIDPDLLRALDSPDRHTLCGLRLFLSREPVAAWCPDAGENCVFCNDKANAMAWARPAVPEPPTPPAGTAINDEIAYGWTCGWTAGYEAAIRDIERAARVESALAIPADPFGDLPGAMS